MKKKAAAGCIPKRRNLVDYPELILQIAPYLDNAALFRCVQVSRAWATQFVPQLWRKVRLQHRSIRMKRIQSDIWQCFTCPDPRSEQQRQSASQAFAKHAGFIRELVVENPGVLQYLVDHCAGLTVLICRFQGIDDFYIEDHRREIAAHVWTLVQKSPRLHTLEIGAAEQLAHNAFSWPFNPDDDQETVVHQQRLHLQKLPSLRRLGVSLADEDYLEFCERFPRLEKARFRLRSLQSIVQPFRIIEKEVGGGEGEGGGSVQSNHDNHYPRRNAPQNVPTVQSSLKSIEIALSDRQELLTAEMLQCLLRRFPKLECIKMFTNYRWRTMLLDLRDTPYAWTPNDTIDRAMYGESQLGSPSLMFCYGFPVQEDDIPTMLAQLPVSLKSIHCDGLNEAMVRTLVAYHSATLEAVGSGVRHYIPSEFHQPVEDMPKAVGLLLTKFPRMKWVNCMGQMYHIRDLIETPWICCEQLDVLKATIVGIPSMTQAEEVTREQVLARYRRRGHEYGILDAAESLAMGKHYLIGYCTQALQDRLDMCPKVWHNFEDWLPEKKPSKFEALKRCIQQ